MQHPLPPDKKGTSLDIHIIHTHSGFSTPSLCDPSYEVRRLGCRKQLRLPGRPNTTVHFASGNSEGSPEDSVNSAGWQVTEVSSLQKVAIYINGYPWLVLDYHSTIAYHSWLPTVWDNTEHTPPSHFNMKLAFNLFVIPMTEPFLRFDRSFWLHQVCLHDVQWGVLKHGNVTR